MRGRGIVPAMRDATTVITGATGFLGREIVLHLLASEPDAHLTLLVRGRDETEAQARGIALLTAQLRGEALADAMRRVEVLRADLEQERLGLTVQAHEELVGRTVEVIHGAAAVSFSLPLEQARGPSAARPSASWPAWRRASSPCAGRSSSSRSCSCARVR